MIVLGISLNVTKGSVNPPAPSRPSRYSNRRMFGQRATVRAAEAKAPSIALEPAPTVHVHVH